MCGTGCAASQTGWRVLGSPGRGDPGDFPVLPLRAVTSDVRSAFPSCSAPLPDLPPACFPEVSQELINLPVERQGQANRVGSGLCEAASLASPPGWRTSSGSGMDIPSTGASQEQEPAER